MLRIAICDDVKQYGKHLTQSVENWAVKRGVNYQIRQFISGEELLADWAAEGEYQVVLLDIDLAGGMDGVSVALEMRKQNKNFCLIFMSQYDDYYKAVFPAYPFYYLAKPILERELAEVLDKAVENYFGRMEIFAFRYQKTTCSIRLREVLYFVSDRRVILIYMESGEVYRYYGKLDELERYLQKYHCLFLRIHKSFLVNSRQIEQFHPRHVIMRNKEQLSISLENRTKVLQFHKELLKGL